MITEDYVSFETAKLLKEKGFNVECSCYYFFNNNEAQFDESLAHWDWNDGYTFRYSAPTLQIVMKWLREEKGIGVIPVLSSILDYEKFLWNVNVVVAKTGKTYSQGWIYEKQEDACEAAIKYCLENLI